jgi:hypothetical protein
MIFTKFDLDLSEILMTLQIENAFATLIASYFHPNTALVKSNVTVPIHSELNPTREMC